MIEFYLPNTLGETLAFVSALVALATGLMALVLPRTTLILLDLHPGGGRGDGVVESRATVAGFRIGLALCAILLAQPFVYLTLGVAFAATAFGRLVSVLFDRVAIRRNLVLVLAEAVLAAAAVADLFQLV